MNDNTIPSSTIEVQIDGKTIKVTCPESHVNDLQQAALHLDTNIREIKNSGTTLERAAIIMALNLSHQLKQQEDQIQALVEATSQYSEAKA